MQLTFKLDRMGDKKLHYNTNYLNPDSEEYQILEFETRQAVSIYLFPWNVLI